MGLKLDKTTKILLGAIALGLFLSSCSDESDLNESFENDPYYGDSFDGGDPGAPGIGDPGYKD